MSFGEEYTITLNAHTFRHAVVIILVLKSGNRYNLRFYVTMVTCRYELSHIWRYCQWHLTNWASDMIRQLATLGWEHTQNIIKCIH